MIFTNPTHVQNQLAILVPGIAGSKLYCKCKGTTRRLYPRKGWFFNSVIDSHAYECRDITTKPLKTFWCVSVYEKFISHMSSSPFNRVEIFSYDWRRDPVDIARDLFEFIRKLNVNQYTHVKLIGHSLGGLVIRIVVEYFNALPDLNISPQQVTVYQCGTPMYGSRQISDYNYGFELAAILTSMGYFFSSCPLQKITNRSIRRVKPFLFSVGDLRRIIQTSYSSMLYLLPTPMIETLTKMLNDGRLHMRGIENFSQVVAVHNRLAQLQFPTKYIFFFNISYHRIERVYIPFRGDIYNKVSVHDICPGGGSGCGIHLARLLKSDGLVVPYGGQKIPRNCSVYVDESEKCHHARLMNSQELWRLTDNSHYNISTDDDLPAYDEVMRL